MIVTALFRLIVAQRRIETNTRRMGGARPLSPQMIRGTDDDDARGGLPLQQIMRGPKRDPRFTRARRGHGKKIRFAMVGDPLEGTLLPVAQGDGPWLKRWAHGVVFIL